MRHAAAAEVEVEDVEQVVLLRVEALRKGTGSVDFDALGRFDEDCVVWTALCDVP